MEFLFQKAFFGPHGLRKPQPFVASFFSQPTEALLAGESLSADIPDDLHGVAIVSQFAMENNALCWFRGVVVEVGSGSVGALFEDGPTPQTVQLQQDARYPTLLFAVHKDDRKRDPPPDVSPPPTKRVRLDAATFKGVANSHGAITASLYLSRATAQGYLGSFITAKMAAHAYDLAMMKFFPPTVRSRRALWRPVPRVTCPPSSSQAWELNFASDCYVAYKEVLDSPDADFLAFLRGNQNLHLVQADAVRQTPAFHVFLERSVREVISQRFRRAAKILSDVCVFKGKTKVTRRGFFSASIANRGGSLYIGAFPTETAAQHAIDLAMRKFFPETVRTWCRPRLLECLLDTGRPCAGLHPNLFAGELHGIPDLVGRLRRGVRGLCSQRSWFSAGTDGLSASRRCGYRPGWLHGRQGRLGSL